MTTEAKVGAFTLLGIVLLAAILLQLYDLCGVHTGRRSGS